MAKRTRFAEYEDRYANYRLELSEEGTLLMQRHTNGGPLVWDWKAHDEMSDGGGMRPLDRAWDEEPWSD